MKAKYATAKAEGGGVCKGMGATSRNYVAVTIKGYERARLTAAEAKALAAELMAAAEKVGDNYLSAPADLLIR